MLEEAMVITDVNSDDITITRRRSPLIGSLQETIAVLASQLMPDALEES
jgi:hypothetical protein